MNICGSKAIPHGPQLGEDLRVVTVIVGLVELENEALGVC